MACSTEKNYRLEAVSSSFGQEAITTVTPVTGLVGGEYFLIASPDVEYYFYFQVNSTGADPAPAGKTSLGYADLPTSYTVAQAVALIVTGMTTAMLFYAEANSDNTALCIESLVPGALAAAPSAGDTGFTVAATRAGWNIDLGQTADGVEISYEPTMFDVIPNQTNTLADQIIQGFKVSVTMGLIQLNTEKYQKLIGAGLGNTKTPSGGTEVVGFGTARNFSSSFDLAGRLVMHPVRLASSVLTDDITVWKSVAKVSGINYSGADLMTMSLTFDALVDESKADEINLMVRGDSTQYMA